MPTGSELRLDNSLTGTVRSWLSLTRWVGMMNQLLRASKGFNCYENYLGEELVYIDFVERHMEFFSRCYHILKVIQRLISQRLSDSRLLISQRL